MKFSVMKFSVDRAKGFCKNKWGPNYRVGMSAYYVCNITFFIYQIYFLKEMKYV